MNDDTRQKRKFLLSVLTDPQNVVAFSAVFISACALFVSFYEARIMRRWQQASLWPRVLIEESYQTRSLDINDYFITVGNAGVGPAIIKGARVEVDGTSYETWIQAYSSLLGEDLPKEFNGHSEIHGDVLSPEESERAMSLNRAEYFDRIMDERERLDVTICYCDVFDTCWTTSLHNREPKPADSCPASRFNFQQ